MRMSMRHALSDTSTPAIAAHAHARTRRAPSQSESCASDSGQVPGPPQRLTRRRDSAERKFWIGVICGPLATPVRGQGWG